MELKPIPVEVCVRALEAVGFEMKQRANGFIVMRKGQKIVVVPGVGLLDAGMQQTILRSADIDEVSFRRLIASQSGLFTKLNVENALATKRG